MERYRSYLLEYRYNRVQEGYASSKECDIVRRGEKIRETGLWRGIGGGVTSLR